jgi:hypothetical protein
VHVLVAELVSRGLVVNWLPIEEPGYGEEPPPADEEEPPAPTDLREPDADEPWVPDVDDPWTGDREPWADEPKTRDGTDADSADQDDVRPGTESLRSRTDDDDVRAPAEAGQPATAEDDAPVRPRGVAAFEVRTAYSSRLNALARGWPPPADHLFLSGPGLRLWVAAAGEPRPGGYSLGFGPDSDRVAVDAALSRAGLAGVVSDAGRRYLISGRKRLARLAELVGERPDAAPPRLWPGGAGA